MRATFPQPPAPPMPMNSRHQARPPLATASVNSCALRINVSASPPTPHEKAEGPCRQEGGRSRRILCAIWRAGSQGCARFPVDSIACHYAQPVPTKRCGQFARFEIPRIVLSPPRVDLFSTRVTFRANAGFFFFSSSFLEEKEREEGGQRAARRSTGPKTGQILYPRVRGRSTGCSVDAAGLEIKHWRGFAGGWGAIPASTACFPTGLTLSAAVGRVYV